MKSMDEVSLNGLKRLLLMLLCVGSIVSCNSLESNTCCASNDIIISDVYSAFNDNISQFVCISGLKGERIKSRYFSITQIHTFKYRDKIFEFIFIHDMIKNKEDNGASGFKIRELPFGDLYIDIHSDEDNSGLLDEILDGLKIKYVKGEDICIPFSKSIETIPAELKDIGAIDFTLKGNRRILTLLLDNDQYSERMMIEKMFDNRDLIYKHMSDMDIIKFQTLKSKGQVIRSYILIDSKDDPLSLESFCGMGPQTKSFDCTYIQNSDN